MPNFNRPITDPAEVEIRSAGAFAAGTQYTNSFSVIDYDAIDIYIKISDRGSGATFTVTAESTGSQDPDAVGTDWLSLLSDDNLADGVTTQPTAYQAEVTAANLQTSATGWGIQLRFATRGAWMRIGITGTAADGSYSVTLMRRANN